MSDYSKELEQHTAVVEDYLQTLKDGFKPPETYLEAWPYVMDSAWKFHIAYHVAVINE